MKEKLFRKMLQSFSYLINCFQDRGETLEGLDNLFGRILQIVLKSARTVKSQTRLSQAGIPDIELQRYGLNLKLNSCHLTIK